MIETPMIRPFWQPTDRKELQDVTVLICQNKTPDLIRLSLESLLTFYPTIKILIVNGTIGDEASNYIRFKEKKHPNIKIWDRVGYDSHGVAMHEAMTTQIDTHFVLALDSDVIIKQGGFIEKMLQRLRIDGQPVWAIGALMNVSDSKDACGWPDNDDDILPYIHPSTGLYNRNVYLDLIYKTSGKSAFTDHGAPCVYTMKYAQKYGYHVMGFEVPEYVMHLSGASWTSPRTVWSCDNDVITRPLVTFISDTYVFQIDKDYDIVPVGVQTKGDYVIHGKEPQEVNNTRFKERLRLTGEYICPVEIGKYIPSDLLHKLRIAPIEDVVTIDGVTFYKRHYYQNTIAWT